MHARENEENWRENITRLFWEKERKEREKIYHFATSKIRNTSKES